jgi:hypothetical protein
VSHEQHEHSDARAPPRESKPWGAVWNGGQMDPSEWEHRQTVQETIDISQPPFSGGEKPGVVSKVKGMRATTGI